MREDKFPSTVVTYNTLIHGYLKAGKLEDAKGLLIKMREDKLQPDVVTYKTLIDSFMRASDFEYAKTLFKESEFFTEKLQPVLNAATSTLDLHGMPHAVACVAILLLSESKLSKVAIVHGQGHHARHEPLAMKRKVLEFIEQQKLPFKSESDVNNAGRTELVRVQ